jgi:hypothetical protein
VRSPVDARLREEAARFVFRFACEDCAHFDERRDRCSLGYPAAPRRDVLDAAHNDSCLELCKAFELG